MTSSAEVDRACFRQRQSVACRLARTVIASISSSRTRASWSLDFSAPEGLALGRHYGGARRYPFTPLNGLSVSGEGGGCNTLTGRFAILEIAIGSDGAVERFAADFEQHCEDAVPALFGIIRYNSTIDDVVPFGGAYPSYQLTVTPPAHGRVTGAGIDCGTGGSTCQVPLGASHLSVTAVPDFGYVFMGWTGDCSGGQTISVHVNGPKSCAALFEPSSPHRLARLVLGQPTWGLHRPGRKAVYSPANSQWVLTSSSDGSRIDAAIEDGRTTAPSTTGQPLAIGYYSAARRIRSRPSTDWSGWFRTRLQRSNRTLRGAGNRPRIEWDRSAVRGRLRTTLRRWGPRVVRRHTVQLDDRRGCSVWRRVSVVPAPVDAAGTRPHQRPRSTAAVPPRSVN